MHIGDWCLVILISDLSTTIHRPQYFDLAPVTLSFNCTFRFNRTTIILPTSIPTRSPAMSEPLPSSLIHKIKKMNTFEGIPAELRLEIYKELLVTDCAFRLGSLPHPPLLSSTTTLTASQLTSVPSLTFLTNPSTPPSYEPAGPFMLKLAKFSTDTTLSSLVCFKPPKLKHSAEQNQVR